MTGRYYPNENTVPRNMQRAKEQFLAMLASQSAQAVAWDRDAIHHISCGRNEELLAPRLYQQFGQIIYVGSPPSLYRWVPDASDELGGKWVYKQ